MKHLVPSFSASIVLLAVPAVHADLTSYSQDFEGLDAASPGALGDDGWLVFGNVFDAGGDFAYDYGVFPAPNGGPGFSSIASGGAGANQGVQYLNVYNDYNNVDHGIGWTIEANVFQEQVIGAGDVGSIWEFTFDYRAAEGPFGPDGSAYTSAWIKVLDPNTGFELVAFPQLETTNASTAWVEGASISIAIDSDWVGHSLQFGFLSQATNYDPTGVYYDNINFAQIPAPGTLALLGLGGLLGRRRRN